MKMDKTWHAVREYVNTVHDGYITRKNMLSYLHSISSLKFSDNYVDTIRNQLEKCGYLGKMKTTSGAVVSGKFYRIKEIPTDLSLGMLRREYDEKISNLQIDI